MNDTTARTTVALVVLVAALPASAQEIITFPDFSDTTGLTLSGSAAVIGTGDGDVIRLASEAEPSGSVFSSTPIATNRFQADFSFRISNPDGFSDGTEPGADGIAFVVQTVSADIGGSGGGLGYQGIVPSVAVEFDTFQNFAFNDISSNHLGVNADGSVDSLATSDVAERFDNAEIWNARVSYDGFTLTALAAPEGLPLNTYSISLGIDIPAVVGQSTAFVGFTAGTAAAFADHDLLSFSYDSTIPTPASAALLALPAIAATRRRR